MSRASSFIAAHSGSPITVAEIASAYGFFSSSKPNATELEVCALERPVDQIPVGSVLRNIEGAFWIV
jgi:hypothetical protein